MKNIEHTILEAFNHILLNHPQLVPMVESLLDGQKGNSRSDMKFLLTLNDSLLKKSKSQLRQDIFVLTELGFKRDGFFVEFGATNGIDLSNTYLMEKEFGWNGILAEPAKCWHAALKENRLAQIETKCVWSKSGINLSFNETDSAELSTIGSFSGSDSHRETRKQGKIYDVETISLNDLLTKFNAPREIDYLSIDTEGSEFDILSSFDFAKYHVKVITCEHNFTPLREELFQLLSSKGYVRKYEVLSGFDDWYVIST